MRQGQRHVERGGSRAQRRLLVPGGPGGRIGHLFALGGHGGTVVLSVDGGCNTNWGHRAALATMQITGAPAGTGLFCRDRAAGAATPFHLVDGRADALKIRRVLCRGRFASVDRARRPTLIDLRPAMNGRP